MNMRLEMQFSMDDLVRYVDESLEMALSRPMRPVEYHCKMLGQPHDRVRASSEGRTFSVWRFDGWEVWAHNVSGASIEVTAEVTPERAWEIWEEYKGKVSGCPTTKS